MALFKPTNKKNYAISLNDSSSTEVSKNDIINDYIKNTGVSYEEASHLLFPSSRMRSVNTTGVDSVSYVRLASSFQDDTVSDYVPGNAGKVYFYCEVSKSGWFRGIKRIIYAGYYAGNLVFSGNFQYALQMPIVFTIRLAEGYIATLKLLFPQVEVLVLVKQVV